MNDALGMQRRERVGDSGEEAEQPLALGIRLEDLPERRAVDEFLHDIDRALGLDEQIAHAGDAGMGEAERAGIFRPDRGDRPLALLLAIGGEIDLLQRDLLAVTEVERAVDLSAAAGAEPPEHDEAPRHAGPAADRFDVLGELFQMGAALALHHVGADAVGELGQVGGDRASERQSERLARLVAPAHLVQRVGELHPHIGGARRQVLLGELVCHLLEHLDRRVVALEQVELALGLEIFQPPERVALVGEIGRCLGEALVGVSQLAERGERAGLLDAGEEDEPRFSRRQLGLQLARQSEGLGGAAGPVQRLADIDLEPQRLTRREIVLGAAGNLAKQRRRALVAPALELDAAGLGERAGKRTLVVPHGGEGERLQQLERGRAVVAAPRIDDASLARDVGEFVVILGGERAAPRLGEIGERTGIQCEPVLDHTAQAKRAGAVRGVLGERRDQLAQFRRKLGRVDVGIDLGLDLVENAVAILHVRHQAHQRLMYSVGAGR